MSANGIGETIASRQFHFPNDVGTQGTIMVIVGKPERSPNATEYCCHFKIIGVGNEQVQTAQGRDSMHALQSALILIGANLNHLNDRLGRRLRWDGAANGDLGFP